MKRPAIPASHGALGLFALATLAIAPTAPALAQVAAKVTADRYALGAVKADFKASRRLGARRAGLVCLPAGSFKWSDARAGIADARGLIATVLHDQAPDAVDAADDPFSDERGATRYKVVATLEDVSLNACVRKWGLAARLAHNHALTGTVQLTIAWEVFDRTTRASVGRTQITTSIELPPETEDAAAALTTGLKANAAQFARQQWPAPRDR